MVQKHNRTQWQNHYSTDLSKLIIFCFFIFLLLLLLCYFLLLFSQISDRATSCNWQYRSDISSLFDWSRPAQRHTISIRKLAQVQCFFPFVMEISFEIVGNFPPQSRCSAVQPKKKGQVVLSSFGFDSYFSSFRLNEPKGGEVQLLQHWQMATASDFAIFLYRWFLCHSFHWSLSTGRRFCMRRKNVNNKKLCFSFLLPNGWQRTEYKKKLNELMLQFYHPWVVDVKKKKKNEMEESIF